MSQPMIWASARARARRRVRRQQRRLGPHFLEVLDDRQGLRQYRVAVGQYRDSGLRVEAPVLGLVLLAAAEVHGKRQVVEPLQVERNAHPIAG